MTDKDKRRLSVSIVQKIVFDVKALNVDLWDKDAHEPWHLEGTQVRLTLTRKSILDGWKINAEVLYG